MSDLGFGFGSLQLNLIEAYSITLLFTLFLFCTHTFVVIRYSIGCACTLRFVCRNTITRIL